MEGCGDIECEAGCVSKLSLVFVASLSDSVIIHVFRVFVCLSYSPGEQFTCLQVYQISSMPYQA